MWERFSDLLKLWSLLSEVKGGGKDCFYPFAIIARVLIFVKTASIMSIRNLTSAFRNDIIEAVFSL